MNKNLYVILDEQKGFHNLADHYGLKSFTLESAVTILMNNGWTPQGGPVAYVVKGITYFVQAMIYESKGH